MVRDRNRGARKIVVRLRALALTIDGFARRLVDLVDLVDLSISRNPLVKPITYLIITSELANVM